MKFSEESILLLNNLNNNLQRFITYNFEVSAIIEASFRAKNDSDFNNLIFKAKYINGLKGVLSNRIVIGDKFMEKIFKEFNENLQEFSNLLKKIVFSLKDEKTEIYFNDKFFELNQDSVSNSMGLIEDLTMIKEFLNNNSGKLFNY